MNQSRWRQCPSWIHAAFLITLLATVASADPKKSVFDDEPASGGSPASQTRPAQTRPAPSARPQPGSAKPSPSADPVTKLPAPDAAAEAIADKKVIDAFGNHEKAPLKERASVAAKMMDAAASMKSDPPTYYALLLKCAGLASSSGDAETALRAADMLSDTFAADFDERVVEWVRKASTVSLSQPDSHKQVEAVVAYAHQVATKKLKFDVAARILAAADSTAKRSTAPTPLRALVAEQQAELKTIQAESAKADTAKATLLRKPTDPDANFALGHFLCVITHDWPVGLPALARGGNAPYRAAALADLANPTESAKQMAAGDNWWDLSEKEPGGGKATLQNRAMTWYDKAGADATLNALDLAKIENRGRLIASANTPKEEVGKWINLLPNIDPQRDQQAGTWKLEGGVLTSGSELGARLQIPYLPPAEYDFRIVFMRNSGSASIAQIASRESEEIIWVIGWPDGKFALNEKVTINKDARLKNGAQYISLIKVRRGGVQFFLNDKLIFEEKDADRLYDHGLWYALHDHRTIGLASQLSSTSFSKIEVLEISGHGTSLK